MLHVEEREKESLNEREKKKKGRENRERRRGKERDGRNEMNEVMMEVTNFFLIFLFSKVNGIVKLPTYPSLTTSTKMHARMIWSFG